MAKVYVEKPRKVHADQFLIATLPWPPSVCTEATPFGICATAPLYPDWRPHVHGEGRVSELHDTDWITTSVAFPAHLPEVLTDTEFEELYGNQPGVEEHMIAFLFALVVLGVLAYILEHYVPMDPVFRVLVRLVIVLIVLGYLVRLLGVPWPVGGRLP